MVGARISEPVYSQFVSVTRPTDLSSKVMRSGSLSDSTRHLPQQKKIETSCRTAVPAIWTEYLSTAPRSANKEVISRVAGYGKMCRIMECKINAKYKTWKPLSPWQTRTATKWYRRHDMIEWICIEAWNWTAPASKAPYCLFLVGFLESTRYLTAAAVTHAYKMYYFKECRSLSVILWFPEWVVGTPCIARLTAIYLQCG